MQKIPWAIFGAFVGLAISLFFRASFQSIVDLPNAIGVGVMFGVTIMRITSEIARTERYGCWLLAICAGLGGVFAALNIPIDGKLTGMIVGPILGMDISLTAYKYLGAQTTTDKNAMRILLISAMVLWLSMMSVLSITDGIPPLVFMVLPLLLTMISFNSTEQKLWILIAGFSIGIFLMVIYAEPVYLVPAGGQWIGGLGACVLSIQGLVRYLIQRFFRKQPVGTFPDNRPQQ